MQIFLCGGGCGEQTAEAYTRLNAVIDHAKPCLYVPLAQASDSYDGCFEWVSGELSGIDVPGIEMIRSAPELNERNLNEYSFIFIGGGNTFKLLDELKECGALETLKKYILGGGTVFGGSAGAIILGGSIELAGFEDENEVGMTDFAGIDVLNGVSIFCHFGNEDEEKTARSIEYVKALSENEKIIALREEQTLLVSESGTELIGGDSFLLFEKGIMTESDRI